MEIISRKYTFSSYYNVTGGMHMEVRLWQARKDKDLTLFQLQKLSGISKSCLNNIETGKTSPTLKQLEKIAKALNIRITDLFESEYK